MFDMGFFELLIIAVVGLVVIGPEKLPATIRTCALWIGRVKRSISETRTEVEKQLGADEIRRQLHNEQILANLEKMRNAHSDLENQIEQLGKEPIEHDAGEQSDTSLIEHDKQEHDSDNYDESVEAVHEATDHQNEQHQNEQHTDGHDPDYRDLNDRQHARDSAEDGAEPQATQNKH